MYYVRSMQGNYSGNGCVSKRGECPNMSPAKEGATAVWDGVEALAHLRQLASDEMNKVASA